MFKDFVALCHFPFSSSNTDLNSDTTHTEELRGATHHHAINLTVWNLVLDMLSTPLSQCFRRILLLAFEDLLARAMGLPEVFLSKGRGGGTIQNSASEGVLVALVAARTRARPHAPRMPWLERLRPNVENESVCFGRGEL